MVTLKRYCRRVTLGVVCALSFWGICCGSAQDGLTITGVGKHNPSGMLTGLSGITYAGGNQYYAVSDSDGLVSPLTIAWTPPARSRR